MSFFGFDATLPRDRGHQANAPGFGQTPDPWAGLSSRGAANDDDALDFEETYDGLGDQLDETDDAFNDDTFGGGDTAKDFDFSGNTAKVAGAMQEEQMLYTARQPPQKEAPKPARTGYESYAQPNYIGNLEARADIWGTVPKKSTPVQLEMHQRQPSQPVALGMSRKMMSLEEVEQAMLNQTKKPAATATPPPGFGAQPPQPNYAQHPAFMGQPMGQPQFPQRPQQFVDQRPPSIPQQQQFHAELPGSGMPMSPMPQHPQVLQHQRPQQESPMNRQMAQQGPQQMPQGPQQMPQGPHQPRQILQNPNRLSGQGQPLAQPVPRMPPTGPAHMRGPSYGGPVVTHPEQLLRMTDAERAAYIEEDARRAKRIHKIHLLSKDNGMMTPQDKNFITRIQLQQLLTATGNVDEQGAEAALAEDFYYQVYSQIRGAPRQNPHQPANQFAQTYLFQTGGRYGMAGRRHHRNGDNHIQRMEQQVQRAVEAAKAKPKNKQLVIEGSLGKISFSNAKTPKPLLNIKRTESGDVRPNSAGHRKVQDRSVADRKATLRDIENVYNTLMQMEDHERNIPPPLQEGADPETIQEHMEWRQRIDKLNEKLWQELKVMEPIIANSSVPHPFIAILSHPKGKKAIPRIFRHINDNQRITILTMIVVHLDTLDVIAHGVAPSADSPPLPRAIKEEIDLFALAVMPALFANVNDSPLSVVLGLLGLVLDRTHIQTIIRTKIGLSVLTMLISRIELIKQSPTTVANPADLASIDQQYNRLFDAIEPVLPYVFPGSVKDDEDVYVWQFLAAMGVGASAEQQQRLVLGVKDRVMDTVSVCKALPKELAAARLGHVNLFMRAIGLDVELLG
ncbi:topoisomerase II-associated protein PAT1 [Saccharata proteae CBS 121410]|uniref:Topoisomerase II-associated protein PAT1 n=1 Tax=Saccharata proteae CBS 121410 TaxID=1314787 RepID=A0A9P4LUP9_9PEZI|nr:topoisomerase II-associated protein PAT1 [Saccharata proteae CBS 121410]